MTMAQEKELRIKLDSAVDLEALEAVIQGKGVKIVITSDDPNLINKPIEVTSASATVETERTYSPILQGNAIQEFTRTHSTKKNTKMLLDGTAQISEGALTVKLTGDIDPLSLKPSTHMFFLAVIKKLTKDGVHSPTVSMTIDDYMHMRGLRSRDRVRRELNKTLTTLSSLSITRRQTVEGKKGEMDAFSWTSLFESGEISKTGVITVSFAPTFFRWLASCNIMPCHKDLLKFNVRKNPNSFYLALKMLYHKNLNYRKNNENLISVKSLLESAIYIPTYEQVMAGNKNVSDRIIDRFIRDMEAVESIFSWEFCHGNGEPLSDDELSINDYNTFSKLLVKFDVKDEYPKRTTRRGRRQKTTGKKLVEGKK